MKKNCLYLNILCLLIFFAINASAKMKTKDLSMAATLIEKLSAKSPVHDGVPLRNYAMRDINNDGVPEVLETVNFTEENTVGLLNIEMAPAFEWITIYKLEKGQYVERTKEFSWFLQKRRSFYQMWLSLLERPDALSSDSKQLILKNKAVFKGAITKLKKKTEH